MKTTKYQMTIVLVMTLIGGNLFAQEAFKNGDEQEVWWAKQAFTAYYEQQSFEKYDGNVIVVDSTFIYGRDTIKVYNQNEFKFLFVTGAIYPSILLFSRGVTVPEVPIRLNDIDTSKSNQNPIEDNKNGNIFHLDYISVGQFTELTGLETSPITHKRFKFLFSIKGLMNPILEFIELTNNRAEPGMSLPAFIKGAKITYLRQGSVLI